MTLERQAEALREARDLARQQLTRPVPIEDPRKAGLKRGLRQLSSEQICRVLAYPIERMALDDGNYVDGKFCPLAVAVGLPEIMKDPTDDRVHAVLTMLGYKVNNTRGIVGKFYTANRAADLRTAAEEVLREREETT
jgi:hypothetical protein